MEAFQYQFSKEEEKAIHKIIEASFQWVKSKSYDFVEEMLAEKVMLSGEFRAKWSAIDAISVVLLITESAIEFNRIDFFYLI